MQILLLLAALVLTAAAAPVNVTDPACGSTHIVQANDTCFSIETQNNRTIGTILSLNPSLNINSNCTNLIAGQVVCLGFTPLNLVPSTPFVPGKLYSQCTVPGTFALTFDDGPFQFSQQLVDTLNAAGVRATFFYNGNNWGNISDYQAVVVKAYESGHLIGSHTWAHTDITTLSDDGVISALSQLENALIQYIGVRPKYFRPPFGNYSDHALELLAARNYTTVLWDLDSNDWDNTTTLDAVKKVYTNTLDANKTSSHIALNHETYQRTVQDIVPWLITEVTKRNLKFVTVAECLGDTDPKNWYASS